jgi:beta-lactamase superfamily II metal-dependent hydrolase
MPDWTLAIHQIDVGQGEATLIVARDTSGSEQRSMLIDSGLHAYGETVHKYVSEHTHNQPLDHIVVSHYDKDHFGGVASLLTADNAHAVAQTIAAATNVAVADVRQGGGNERLQAVAGAAAAVATAIGGYDVLGNPPGDPKPDDPDPRRNVFSDFALQVGVAAAKNLETYLHEQAILDLKVAAALGYEFGVNYASGLRGLNPGLLPGGGQLRKKVCVAASQAAVKASGGITDPVEAARGKILPRLHASIPLKGAGFDTGGFYSATSIIDPGNGRSDDPPGDGRLKAPADYLRAANGGVLMASNAIEVPLRIRKRSTPNLGSELLWNSGRNKKEAQEGAPMVFLLAVNGNILGTNTTIAFAEDDNDTSIGLLIKFNKFYFYTGGDLPSEGEQLIWNFLKNTTNRDNTKVDHICCFKCGHHGTRNSSSQTFVTDIKARAALISAGKNARYKHPDQEFIDILQMDNNIQNFYLTNRQYEREYVPWPNEYRKRSDKSLISGDNALDNLGDERRFSRGNIVVDVAQESSLSDVHPADPNYLDKVNHGFHVTYYENRFRRSYRRNHDH